MNEFFMEKGNLLLVLNLGRGEVGALILLKMSS